ncbi:MAG: hypothetical protein BAJALOKI1v1_20032 [Promethearchaeota archaeon]|nr:MAG: hypothetical protein BAJALOKI1v1_20032 [Candidatus Lokiarchaeota archaeon]
MKEYNLLKIQGCYSKNFRLDTSKCEEPKHDTKEVRERWLGENSTIRIKRKLKRWKSNITPTIPPQKLTVHMVGQSHIDIAWMWREEQTRKKAQVTYTKAVLHSELFPDKFCFALSQPILLEWILEDNPQLFKEIQAKVRAGNIELVGGSYVEPDAMMPSDEAMIRQRLYGMRFYKTYFNKLPQVEWLLDSFGYNYGLPQILVKSGVKFLWTSKMTWNKDTIFPFTHFWWQSPDGSKLRCANFHYDPQVLETWETYEIGRHLLKDQVKRMWRYEDDYSTFKNHVDNQKICPHVGLFFGKSDGGHGPTHKEVAEVNKLSELKWFRWSTVSNFFEDLVPYSSYFPIWNDELYLEFHRGCFSNHAQVKRYNRKFENLLPSLESLLSIVCYFFSDFIYPRKQMEYLWKKTLKNQFHDILPGSSIPEVYDDCWEDWKNQQEVIDKLIINIGEQFSYNKKHTVTTSKRELLLFNPLSWKRKSPLFIPSTIFEQELEELRGKELPYAKLIVKDHIEQEYICQPFPGDPEDSIDPRPSGWWTVFSIEALSFSRVTLQLLTSEEYKSLKSEKSIRDLKISGDSISNDLTYIKINKQNGALIELRSAMINNNENLLSGKGSNLTFCYRDRVPIKYHAWNLTPKYWNHLLPFQNNKNVKISIIQKGPVYSRLSVSKVIGKDTIHQNLTLFKECPQLFLEYFTDWSQKDIMVKIKYTPATNSQEVIADGMACAISSKIHPETPCDIARFEKICHKYFDFSTPNNKWGIAIINEGKYAFDVLEEKMSLTLLRACRYPESAPEAWINKERELNERIHGHEVPEYSGLGLFSCRYALFPHKGGALLNMEGSANSVVKKKAEEFNNPILIIPLGNFIPNENEFSMSDPFLKISPHNIILNALKVNEWDMKDELILRFKEICGVPTEVCITFNEIFSQRIKTIFSVDLIEREEKRPFTWDIHKRTLIFRMGKYELRTFKLQFF